MAAHDRRRSSPTLSQPRTTPPSATPRQEALIELLDAWLSEDEPANPAEWEDLKRSLDAHRLSDRKLFP
jgi:hypothetical protein